MSLLDVSSFPLPVNLAMFAVAAVFVWLAGARLTGYLDGISDRTGLGQAFVGMLLLGGITSLPEIAAVSSSALTSNAALATNNLLGSVAINVVLLAIGDAMLGRDAITSVVGKPITLMQGVLVVVALAMAASATVTGDIALGRLVPGQFPY